MRDLSVKDITHSVRAFYLAHKEFIEYTRVNYARCEAGEDECEDSDNESRDGELIKVTDEPLREHREDNSADGKRNADIGEEHRHGECGERENQ